MKIAAVCAACVGLLSCSSSSGNGEPSLVGNWIYTNSAGTAGIAADFKSDGTYVLALMELTSTTSANAEVETGTYTSTSTSFTATPKMWTCPSPDTVSTINYSFQNGNLIISESSGLVTLQPNTSSVMSSFSITYGCTQSGSFVKEPLAPVTN